MPRVSVIVPVYNVEKYLRECLDSLVAQKLQDIEIVCVNDGSTDKSGTILDEYAQKDKRIKVVTQENGGLSAARNTGIENSSAPYLMFCDSDDYYDVSACQVMYEAMESSHADVAVSDVNMIYEIDDQCREADEQYYRIKTEGLVERTIKVLQQTNVPVWNKIYRRELITKYDIQFPVGLRYEDTYFYNVYMLHVKNVFFIDKKLYNYRRRDGGIMNQTFKPGNNFSIDHLRIFFKIYEFYKKEKCEVEYEEYLKKTFRSLAFFAFRYTSTIEDWKNIYAMGKEFVSREFGEHAEKYATWMEQLNIVTPKIIRPLVRKLGGLYRTRYDGKYRSIYICGIRIRKIKI